MSEMEAAAAVGAVACVPDVISNILESVPDLVSLFRCSLVCKGWHSIVADPAFLRRRGIWPKQGGQQSQSSASLVGIFVQRNRPLGGNSRPRKTSKLFPTRAPAFVPSPGSVLGPQRRFLTSFVRDAGDLPIVRIWRPRSTDKNSGGGVLMRQCVCNLLTGGRDLLPALHVDDDAIRVYALLTAANYGAGGPHDALLTSTSMTTPRRAPATL